jgi:hypothetical protein
MRGLVRYKKGAIRISKYVGDVPITGLDYQFYNGKLFGVTMFFHTLSYFKIREMLAGKYGQPSSEREEPIQNVAGATFDNIVSEWKFQEGSLKLRMRFGNVNSGMLSFDDPTVSQEIYGRQTQKHQAKGKKAF